MPGQPSRKEGLFRHPVAAPVALVGLLAALWYCFAETAAAAAWYGSLEPHYLMLPPILARQLPAWLRFSTMDFFGSVICCADYKRKLKATGQRHPWFGGLAICTLMQFGGTTLVGLLLGQPPSWTLSHNAPRSLLAAFWLTFALPGDYWFKAYEASYVAKLFFATGAALSSGHAITSWGADKALNAMHERARTAVFSTLTGQEKGDSTWVFSKRFPRGKHGTL